MSSFSLLAFSCSSKSRVFLGTGLKNEKSVFGAAGDDVDDEDEDVFMAFLLLKDEGLTNGPELLATGVEDCEIPRDDDDDGVAGDELK